jgi:hypothetical protein
LSRVDLGSEGVACRSTYTLYRVRETLRATVA